MNLNLSSVFEASTLRDVFSSYVKEINIDKLIKIVLALSCITIAILSGSLVEFLFVILVTFIFQRIHTFYKEIVSIDLNFDNSDIELNEIINDLWE